MTELTPAEEKLVEAEINFSYTNLGLRGAGGPPHDAAARVIDAVLRDRKGPVARKLLPELLRKLLDAVLCCAQPRLTKLGWRIKATAGRGNGWALAALSPRDIFHASAKPSLLAHNAIPELRYTPHITLGLAELYAAQAMKDRGRGSRAIRHLAETAATLAAVGAEDARTMNGEGFINETRYGRTGEGTSLALAAVLAIGPSEVVPLRDRKSQPLGDVFTRIEDDYQQSAAMRNACLDFIGGVGDKAVAAAIYGTELVHGRDGRPTAEQREAALKAAEAAAEQIHIEAEGKH